MLGTRFYKADLNISELNAAAKWTVRNGAMIEDKGDYYEVVTVPVYEPSEDDKKAARIAELKQNLSETDYAIIKIAEGVACKEEYADIIEQRQAWRDELNKLGA